MILLISKTLVNRTTREQRRLVSIFHNCAFLIFVNSQLDAQFFFLYLFIPVLYMFRATKCSSSGDSIVSIRPRVYVTVCRWPCGMQVWMEIFPSKPTYHTVTYIEWHIPEIILIQLTLLMMSTWLLETCRELE